jgi:autotransporter-associated beta strand protein
VTAAIPATIEGRPVTKIGAGAFYQRAGLTSVSFPGGLVSIGTNAFEGCSGLASVSIPLATTLGAEAFSASVAVTRYALVPKTGVVFDTSSALTEAPASLRGVRVGNAFVNPGFEANSFQAPGYATGLSAINGWSISARSQNPLIGAGVDFGGGAFANSGQVPGGTRVGFLQSNFGEPTTLSTLIGGLSPGNSYRLSFRANRRLNDEPSPATSIGQALFEPFTLPSPEGGGVYGRVYRDFIAQAGSVAFSVRNLSASDSTLLVDDFSVAEVDGGLVKRGPGVLTLVGGDDYIGDTVVEAGTLRMKGSAALMNGNILNKSKKYAKINVLLWRWSSAEWKKIWQNILNK